jgi:hypothetical protein
MATLQVDRWSLGRHRRDDVEHGGEHSQGGGRKQPIDRS